VADTQQTPNILTESRFQLYSIFRALKYRNYRLFISGQFISLIGTWMQVVAQSWLVYRLTGSSLLLGLVGFVNQIPIFLLSPIGGAVADRADRRQIVIGAQASMMMVSFLLAGLTLMGWIQIWEVLVLAGLLGVANAFDIPARQSFFVEMVGKADLMNAIALNSSVFNSARIIGPAIAGVLVAAIGEGWCFFVNAVSYLAVITGLLMMKLDRRAARHQAGSAAAEILEGFRFFWRTGPINALLTLLGLVSLVGMPYSVLMPIFADQILHGGAIGLGLLTGAAGIGALSGALTIAARRGVKGLGRLVAVSCTGFGLALILFSLSQRFWLSVALLVPVGFMVMLQMASSNTLIQTMVPDVLRGRVMALYSMMLLGMAPFGALLAGAVAEQLGAPLTVASGGTVCLVGAAIFWYRWPALRVQARQLIVAQQMAGGDPPEQTTGAGSPQLGEEDLTAGTRRD
jgi:MFS family permease